MQEFTDHSPLTITAAQGCWLEDVQGKRYLDGVSSLWANVHGHRHPVIDKALQEQINRVAHSTMLGLSHPGGIELARQLVQLAPAGLSRVFYSDSGATSVEIALKMAYQYWQLQGETRRHKFLKLSEAYHGDTIGAVSLGGMDLFHERFGRLLFETIKVPTPHTYRHPFESDDEKDVIKRYFAVCEELIRAHADEACGFIVEPLIQGAAGMIVHPSGYLKHLRDLTRKHNMLFIVDEVAVGFGRTGRMFASEWEDVSPDLLCLGKGITGGYLPLAATLASEEIFAAFLGDYKELKTFFHGHTYTGNPLACAAALASLEVFAEEKTLDETVFGPKAEKYSAGMRHLAKLDHVGSVRYRGLMGGVELVRDKESKAPYPFEERLGYQVILEARKNGVMLRPLGDVIVLMPPLAVSLEELDILFAATEAAIIKVTES
ncbi:MAG: adenosylmethionine--8-amino-7-oxononanoate transaminase [Deltaproteobacteria bacterium]|jgi:adenosylmethionine-8-amino-7-oxononanoate aminotransferase|nr:adenosylmethionine--8-amino-7-oxononanoate transaminase [Deltaproteobacteria bacterium]